MDKTLLVKIQEQNSKVKVNLKNGLFYTGYIIGIEESSILFRDKYDDEILIDLDSISYVIPTKNEVNKHE